MAKLARPGNQEKRKLSQPAYNLTLSVPSSSSSSSSSSSANTQCRISWIGVLRCVVIVQQLHDNRTKYRLGLGIKQNIKCIMDQNVIVQMFGEKSWKTKIKGTEYLRTWSRHSIAKTSVFAIEILNGKYHVILHLKNLDAQLLRNDTSFLSNLLCKSPLINYSPTIFVRLFQPIHWYETRILTFSSEKRAPISTMFTCRASHNVL